MQNGLSISINAGKIKFGPFVLNEEKLDESEKPLVFQQELIVTKTTGENLVRILYPTLERRNVLLVGDAGIGKNALVYFINKVRNLPTIRFSFNQDTLPEDLVGSFRILPDGFHWQDGPLVEAMKNGYTFVADEMNLASPEILKRFTSVLEHRTLNLLEKDGNELKAHPRFNFVATQNPSRGFEGRKILPESISRLFTVVNLESYPLHEEVEIIHGLYSYADVKLVEKVVLLQRKIETAIWASEIAKDDLEHYHLNLRTGQRVFQRLSQLPEAEKLSDENIDFMQTLFSFYVNIFRLSADRELALSYMANVFSYAAKELNEIYSNFNNYEPATIEGTTVDAQFSLDPLPLTQNRLRSIEQIKLSLANNENLLLEGEESVRLGELVSELALAEGRTYRFIHLAKGMHTSEIIGALRPEASKNGKSTVQWVDGPLVQGLKKQDWIILDNIEAAGSELVEKLNMLLDHAASLMLPPEAEGETIIKRTGHARVIALKRARKSRNQGTISRAFRNRFFSMHVATVDSQTELNESAQLFWQYLFGELDSVPSDKEYSESIANNSIELINKMLLFHLSMNEAAENKKIAQSVAEKIKFREENLLRWISHIHQWLGENKDFTLRNVLFSGIEVHYLAALPTSADREWGNRLWLRIFQDLPLEQWHEAFKGRKKKLLKQSERRKMSWDQKKHWRAANTGKAKPRLSGRNLKKGVKINTPETGGKTKEGADAWYGEDTEGNQGNGEPQGGGGAWGYRTEELFEAFLKKYKPKWDYNLGYQLQDYYEIFGKMLEELEMDLDNALESNMHIERRLATYGSRVEARRYLAYMANKGSDRIFDHSRIIHTEDKLKGLEFAFFINKGRRLFNFQYSVASIVAVQSAMEVLWDKKIPLRTYGYSDHDNQKKSLDLTEYTSDPFNPPLASEKEHIFDQLSDDWQGDTVEEYQLVQSIEDCFSTDATTRIAVLVSDFRGHRARAKIEDEIRSDDNIMLAELVKQYSQQNYVFLGMQTGSRYLAEHLFEHHLWINEETFDRAPMILAEEIKNIILKYHRPSV